MTENTGQQSQADQGQQSQADNQQQSANSQADQGQQSQSNDTPEVLKGKLEKSIAAEKNLRERLRQAEAAEAELKKLKEKDLSEVERLKTQLAEKEKAATDAAAKVQEMQVKVAAQAAGFDPELSALWLAKNPPSEFTEDAIKAALAKGPANLKVVTGTTTPPNNPGRQGTTLTKDQLLKMSAQEIARLDQKLVDAVLAAG